MTGKLRKSYVDLTCKVLLLSISYKQLIRAAQLAVSKEHIKAVSIPLGCMFCSAWELLALLQYLLFLILLS